MNFKKIDPRLWTILIFISIGAIIGASYLIINEILEAKKECNALGGEYNFKIVQGHFCNTKLFVKHYICLQGRECNMIWDFEDSIEKINVSEFIK